MKENLVDGHGRSQSGRLKESYIKNLTKRSYLLFFGTVKLSPKNWGNVQDNDCDERRTSNYCRARTAESRKCLQSSPG